MQEIEGKLLNYMELSPAVKDFLIEGGFRMVEEESGKTLNDVWLDCRRILLGEVTEYGIEVLHPEEMMLDGYKGETFVFLRELFEEDKLKDFFYHLTENDRERFKSFLNDGESDAAFGLVGIIDFMTDLNPNNYELQRIRYYVDEFIVNKTFYTRVWHLLLTTNTYEPSDHYTNIEIMNYLKFKFDHITNVRIAAGYFERLKFDGELDLIELKSRLALHDIDVVHGDSLREIVAFKSIRDQIDPDPQMKKLADDQMMCHYLRNRHHMDYFIGKEEDMSLVDQVEILSDIYKKQETKEEYLKDMEEIMTLVPITEDTKNKLRSLAERFNIWSEVKFEGA